MIKAFIYLFVSKISDVHLYYIRLASPYYRSGETFIYSTNRGKTPQRSMLLKSLWHSFTIRVQLAIMLTTLLYLTDKSLYVYILRPSNIRNWEYKIPKSIVGRHNGTPNPRYNPQLRHIYFGRWSRMSYNHPRPLHSSLATPYFSLSSPPFSLSIIIFNKTYSANSLMTVWKSPLLKLARARVSGCGILLLLILALAPSDYSISRDLS